MKIKLNSQLLRSYTLYNYNYYISDTLTKFEAVYSNIIIHNTLQ